MSEQKIKETYDYAVQQNIAVLRNRINELGVAEPLIHRDGKDRLVVELPGVQDTAEAKKILGRTATLEFHLENAEYSAFEYIDKAPPRGTKFFETNNGRPILLNEEVILSGQSITDAGFGFDEDGYPQVNISIDTVGARRFSDVTGDNIGEPMATVFIEYKTKTVIENGVEKEVRYRDEKVINVATIRAKLGNRFRITGLDSPNEARELALLLRAGALIAPIYIVEERTVGPAMGQKNIDMGVQAIVLGLSLVVIFMIAYYRVFGLVANVALFLNLVLIVALMSSIGAVLTLPGIAGIVLTVGMAVDANVLIFQRIREELAEGLSPQKAIHEGYDRAFSTIADANITTLVASVILFAVGTGPIKGFAITLSIGILTSMFTAIFGTRAIVNLMYGGKPVKKLPIGGKA
jgi:preprotein translocase subunit SecD